MAVRADTESKKGELFLLALLPYLYMCYRLWWVCDDAFITFRYSRNLAQGHGLRYNLGEHIPVEGYSNFLWVLVCSVFEFFSVAIERAAPCITIACGAILLYRIYRFIRIHISPPAPLATLITLSLGLFPPFAIWSTSGLETMAYSLCLFLTFEYLVLSPSRYWRLNAGFFAVCAALLRVEGIAWVAVLLALTILSWWINERRILKPLVSLAVLIISAYGVYFVWRLGYFGELLPNTVAAKSDLSTHTMQRGWNYVAVFFLTFLNMFLFIPGLFLAFKRSWVRFGYVVAPLSIGFIIYAILVGGDFMSMGRFLVPAFPFWTLLLAITLKELLENSLLPRRVAEVAIFLVMTLGLLPLRDIYLVPEEIRAKFHFRHNKSRFVGEMDHLRFMQENSFRWKRLGTALARVSKPGDSLVAGAIGNVGYFSNLFIYDRFGLVSREVIEMGRSSRRKRSPGHDYRVAPRFFLPQRPTYLAAYVVRKDRKERIRKFEQGIPANSLYAPMLYPLAKDPERLLLVIRRVPNEYERKELITQYESVLSDLPSEHAAQEEE